MIRVILAAVRSVPIFVALLAAAALTAPTAPAAVQPSLRLVTSVTLTLRGTGFRPHEPVRVTVQMGSQYRSLRLVASSRGGFTARFPGTRLDACALPLVVAAAGPRSGRVEATLPPRDCAMP